MRNTEASKVTSYGIEGSSFKVERFDPKTGKSETILRIPMGWIEEHRNLSPAVIVGQFGRGLSWEEQRECREYLGSTLSTMND